MCVRRRCAFRHVFSKDDKHHGNVQRETTQHENRVCTGQCTTRERTRSEKLHFRSTTLILTNQEFVSFADLWTDALSNFLGMNDYMKRRNVVTHTFEAFFEAVLFNSLTRLDLQHCVFEVKLFVLNSVRSKYCLLSENRSYCFSRFDVIFFQAILQ